MFNIGQKPCQMRSPNPSTGQLSLLCPTLRQQLNPKHSLYQLAETIDWGYFEKAFAGLYSNYGRPAHPVRLMVSLLILKALYDLSDEALVEEHWEMNAYFQFFSGATTQQWGQPCSASDLSHFRKRIGKQGAEKIFGHSIALHGKDALDKHVSVDTTVQEKNITYPTDSKLHKKIADKCVKIAQACSITLRRSYVRTAKQLLRDTYNGHHPKRRKKAAAAKRKLKTIAARLVRELRRKLPSEAYAEQLSTFEQVLGQSKNSKDKVYSLHEPEVYCIAKGKAHKKYEYGNKASLVVTQNTGIIVGAMVLDKNVYDGHSLQGAIEQTTRLTGQAPQTATVDRGYSGKNQVGDTQVVRPSKPLKRDNTYQRRKKRRHCRRRAAIEPIIGHLKSDHRVIRNYLKGSLGDHINFLMAAGAFNFKKVMKKLKKKLFCLFLIKVVLVQKWLENMINTKVPHLTFLKTTF